MLILLFGTVTQAKTTDDQQESSQKKSGSTVSQHEKTDELTEKKDEDIISILEKACIVNKFKKAEQNWDYEHFNWVKALRFFTKYMTYAEFLEATKNKKCAIANLTKIIIEKDDNDIQTEVEALFFIYSALITLHDHYVEKNLQEEDSFHLLEQVASVLPNNKLKFDICCDPPELSIASQHKILMQYKYHFLNNPNIRLLRLTNTLKELIMIMKRRNEEDVPNYAAAKSKPSVEDLFVYCEDSEQPAMFLNLIKSLTMLKKPIIHYQSSKLQPEKALETMLIDDFNDLWQTSKIDHCREHLAKVAVFLFETNPLQDDFNS